MPACCIINCTSRTDSAHKTIKLFRFPKDKSIRQQWIKACRRNEIDINIDAARICNLHFQEDCFEIKWTKPRAKNVPAKEIRRLKKNSVPSLLLHLEKKNKMKAKVRMGIPTYAELVKYAQQKQQTQEHEQNLSNEIVREEDIQDIHTMNSEDVNEQNISAEELKQLLIKEKKEKEMLLKEKNELLQEKQTLLRDNEKLKQQMDVLMKKITEKKDKEKDDKVPIHVLQKVFTAGQIKLLMSSNTNTRIKWSAEDITSAIALRSISPKAYRYLRNVKKMPLPCMSTLNNSYRHTYICKIFIA